jgi:hypothetical protein
MKRNGPAPIKLTPSAKADFTANISGRVIGLSPYEPLFLYYVAHTVGYEAS